MQFKREAKVLSVSGQDLGRLDRVVLDPQTKEVRHIVVRKGHFFTADKVIPISLVETAVDEEITLRSDAGDMYLLPDFQEKNFVVVNEHELLRSSGAHTSVPSLYWYPSAIGPSDFAYPGSSGPAYLEQVKENIPQGTVALKEGAKVISADDKHVGNVEQVLTSPETDLATYFVISKGLLLKERKLVPTFWVSRLDEENVYLAVGSHLLDELRPYSEKSQPEMA